MRTEDILAFLRRRPLQPFRLHVLERTVYIIRHPELLLVGRSALTIHAPAADESSEPLDRSVMVSLLHISRLEPLEPAVSPI
jgi:hypothetical protein